MDVRQENGFAILSKNSDFYHFSMMRGAPPKVAWLRVGNDGTPAIVQLIRSRAKVLNDFAGNAIDTLLILGQP